MAAKLSDVALRAGVSTATVSRVLTNSAPVTEDVRQRVLTATADLQYQPNRIARSLRAQRTRIIGLIISDIQNPFFIALVRAVEDIAQTNHFAVFLCNTDENVKKEALYIDLMLAEQVAGVIISPSQERNDPSRKLIEAGVPVVVIDRRMSDATVDTVVVDNQQATFDLISHLISDGHRRIGAVVGNPTATTGRERRDGYEKALAANGIAVTPDLIRSGLPREEIGYTLTAQLLDLSEPPSAIFAANNLLSIGAFRAIQDRGLRIPQDIGLVAFDEIEWMSLVKPGLTVVAQPTYTVGRTAADLLMKRVIDAQRPPQEIVLPASLRIRQSCAAHPLSD